MSPLGCWPPEALGLIGASAFFLSLADNGRDGSRPSRHRPSSSETKRPLVPHRFLRRPCGHRAGPRQRLPAEHPGLAPRSRAPSRSLRWRTWQLRIASARLGLAEPRPRHLRPSAKRKWRKTRAPWNRRILKPSPLSARNGKRSLWLLWTALRLFQDKTLRLFPVRRFRP